MTHDRDDWEKPRSKGEHLTLEELKVVRRGYQDQRDIRAVARELKCSSRTVIKYYGLFRAEGVPRNRPEPAKPLPNRFYHTNFEPS